MNKIAWSIPLRIFTNIESKINKHFKFILKTIIEFFDIASSRPPELHNLGVICPLVFDCTVRNSEQ